MSFRAPESFRDFGGSEDGSAWKYRSSQGQLRRHHFLCHSCASISDSKAGFFARSSQGPDDGEACHSAVADGSNEPIFNVVGPDPELGLITDKRESTGADISLLGAYPP